MTWIQEDFHQDYKLLQSLSREYSANPQTATSCSIDTPVMQPISCWVKGQHAGNGTCQSRPDEHHICSTIHMQRQPRTNLAHLTETRLQTVCYPSTTRPTLKGSQGHSTVSSTYGAVHKTHRPKTDLYSSSHLFPKPPLSTSHAVLPCMHQVGKACSPADLLTSRWS